MKPHTDPRKASLMLRAETAADLMTPNPVSLRRDAFLQEAIALLTDRGFSAAPVIDEAGRPIGVLSRTDILVHERERVHHAILSDETDWDAPPRHRRHERLEVEVVDQTEVEDIMTPVVFTVNLYTPASEVVRQMLALKVHQLYVIDLDGVLVGVISGLDVLRRLEE
jgi:CBS domain-containing protein